MKYSVDSAVEAAGFGPAQFLYIAASSTVFYLELLCLVSDGILLPLIKCDFRCVYDSVQIYFTHFIPNYQEDEGMFMIYNSTPSYYLVLSQVG